MNPRISCGGWSGSTGLRLPRRTGITSAGAATNQLDTRLSGRHLVPDGEENI